MDEGSVQKAIKDGLHWYEWMCWHNPRNTRFVMSGYPDLRLEHPKRFTCFIEVKDIARSAEGKWSKSFSFSEVDDDQRKFLNKWQSLGFEMYLGIGKISPRGKTKTEITDIWVFPWVYWLEEVESRFQKSIAYDWALYEKLPSDWQSKPDIVSLNPIYRLTKKQGREAWQFDPSHPLAVGPRVEVPYHLRGEEGEHTHEISEPFPIPSSTDTGHPGPVV